MNVLVFGGNGFIGSSVVRELLLMQNCSITVVNRGKSWDWDKAETIQPHVKCIEWDRRRPLADCAELVQLTTEVTWQVVIDFSAYDGKVIKDTCTCLGSSINLYIYISSDSVYEVCERHKDASGLSKETDAVRPVAHQTRKALKRQDSYGHKKLKGEEELLKAHKLFKFRYVIFRLADVVGSMDSTDRWWSLQLWVTMCAQNKNVLLLPKDRQNTQLSLVFVEDIARLLKSLTEQSHDLSSEVLEQAYNLACEETPTLESLVQDIALTSTGKQVEIRYTDSSKAPDYYPSVERGPVSINKAQSLISWKPSSLETVIKQTVKFYKTCMESKDKYQQEKRDIYREIKKDLSPLYNPEDLRCFKSILNLK